MQTGTMARIGIAAWLAAAAPLAFAADAAAKAETQATPASGEARDAKPTTEANRVKRAGPHLRMAAHRGKNPGRDRDLRHCLDLPTNEQVIRCSEQK